MCVCVRERERERKRDRDVGGVRKVLKKAVDTDRNIKIRRIKEEKL